MVVLECKLGRNVYLTKFNISLDIRFKNLHFLFMIKPVTTKKDSSINEVTQICIISDTLFLHCHKIIGVTHPLAQGFIYWRPKSAFCTNLFSEKNWIRPTLLKRYLLKGVKMQWGMMATRCRKKLQTLLRKRWIGQRWWPRTNFTKLLSLQIQIGTNVSFLLRSQSIIVVSWYKIIQNMILCND